MSPKPITLKEILQQAFHQTEWIEQQTEEISKNKIITKQGQIVLLLRMVPTFVSKLTFCALREAWFNHHPRFRVDIDVINSKKKPKFS